MLSVTRLFLTIILLITVYSSHAQDLEAADSLFDNVYVNFTNDTIKVNLLYKKAFEIKAKSNSIALKYAEEALSAALITGSKKHILKTKSLIGILNFRTERYSDALELYKEVETIAREIGDKEASAINNVNITNVLIAQNKFKEAEVLLLNSLDYFNKNNNYKMITYSLNELSVIHINLKQFISAEEFLKKGLENLSKYSDYEMSMTLNSNLGSLYEQTNKLDLAIIYYKEALKWANLMDNEMEIADAHNNLAFTYLAQNKLNEAELNAREALRLCLKNEYGSGTIDSYEVLKDIFTNAGNKDSALYYQEKFFTTTIAKNEERYLSGAYNTTSSDETKMYDLENEVYLLKYIIGVLSLFLVLLFIALRRLNYHEQERKK